MEIIDPSKPLDHPTTVTIGTFDGVHKGHRQIFTTLLESAHHNGLTSLIITFEPPPKRFFSKGKIQNLTTLREKLLLLEELGIDKILVLPFNRELVNTGYSNFIQHTVIEKLKAKTIVAGYDFRFGHNRNGDTNNIQTQDIEVIEVPPFTIDRTPVKSSTIRTFILDAQIELANQFLGYKYLISGKRIRGRGLGTKLGFPTINISHTPEKLLPSKGVYGAFERTLGPGLLYIGNRPTIDNGELSIEIHLITPPPDPLPDHLFISLHSFIRKDIKFPSHSHLTAQLSLDKKNFQYLLLNNS